jgi:hypothetical protein
MEITAFADPVIRLVGWITGPANGLSRLTIA